MAAGQSAGECVLAIDIGTQSTRAALVEPSGHILGTAASPVGCSRAAAWVGRAGPGGVVVDDAQQYRHRRGEPPGMPHRRHRSGGADARAGGARRRAGRADRGRSAIWSDKRCAEQVEGFKRRPDAGSAGGTGRQQATPAWAGFQDGVATSSWPEAYAGAAKLLVVKDFVNQRLCGEVATDPSESSGSFLCDAATGQWSAATAGRPRHGTLQAARRSSAPRPSSAAWAARSPSRTGVRPGRPSWPGAAT